MNRMRRGSVGPLSGLVASLTVVGFDAPFTIFSRASDESSRVTSLTWFMILLATVIYLVVMAVMIAAIRRNRRSPEDQVMLADATRKPVVIGGAVIPALVLGTIWVVTIAAARSFPAKHPVMTIHVAARQWWWQVDYDFADPGARFRTANEIHLPVGQTVRLVLQSKDVIHSFWVPRLNGKMDVIPGTPNEIHLRAREPGTFGGECAEFCGQEHAKMRLVVVAEDSAAFEGWAARQRAPAESPTDSLAAVGSQVFTSRACPLCHAVRGTGAAADVAPDLTHVGSRRTIAAGTLGNTLGNLEAWVVNAPALKPGTQMPPFPNLSGVELRAVAAYLENLK